MNAFGCQGDKAHFQSENKKVIDRVAIINIYFGS